jgi:hypothetical protein
MPPVNQIRVKIKSGQIYVEVNNPNLVMYTGVGLEQVDWFGT